MNWIVDYIVYPLVFPGFLFAAVAGMLSSWFDRKITARIQWRQGPPPMQPLYDVIKLLGKETLVPAGASQTTFLLSPLAGLAAVTLVSTLIWVSMLWPSRGFVGDLFVVLYFLMIPSLAVIMGGFASKNPLASLGASREMKLMLAYELPFLLAVLVPVIQSGGAIRLGQLVEHQALNGPVAGSLSGTLAMVSVVLVIQAKLTLVPFDMSEAETEIMGGTFVEYSGPPLAVFKLTRMMMQFTLPAVAVLLFLGGVHFSGWSILWSVLKFLLFLLLMTLIRNTNPRLRIDQAMKWFWGPVTGLSVCAVVLALLKR
jgi:NADH-quinone oxidoreductase subunit H